MKENHKKKDNLYMDKISIAYLMAVVSNANKYTGAVKSLGPHDFYYLYNQI